MVTLEDGTLRTVGGALVSRVRFKRFDAAGGEVEDTGPYSVVDGGYLQTCRLQRHPPIEDLHWTLKRGSFAKYPPTPLGSAWRDESLPK